ncbi:MAG: DNA polymerase Y family protein [Verrucomicrobiota bacterium]
MFAVIVLRHPHLQSAVRTSAYDPQIPLAVLHTGEDIIVSRDKAVIWQMNTQAKHSGVSPGLTASQALARCSDLQILPRNLPQEHTVSTLLLQTAGHYSPRIEATEFGMVTLDLDGSTFLPDRLASMSQSILDELECVHLKAQVGVAPTPDLAQLAAHTGRPFHLLGNHPDEVQAFLQPLPPSWIHVSENALNILQLWGVRTLGALLSLPQQELRERLGSEVVEQCTRLRRDTIRPLKVVPPPQTFCEVSDLEHPIECLEPLLFLLQRFLEQLAHRLDSCYLAFEQVLLEFAFDNGSTSQRRFKIPEPTTDINRLLCMIHGSLEHYTAPSPLIRVSMEAVPTRPPRVQRGLFENYLKDPQQFAETLTQLCGVVGSDRIGSPHICSMQQPDAIEMQPFQEHQNNKDSPKASSPVYGLPMQRYRPPLPVDVQVDAQKQPIAFTSTRMSGRIRAMHGPWLNSGGWWQSDQHWERREWDVQSHQGELFRLVQTSKQWVIEGRYA